MSIKTTKDVLFCPLFGPAGTPHGVSSVIVNTSTKVFINNSPVISVGDEFLCSDGTKSKVTIGSSKIFVNNKPVALSSSTTCHGGLFGVNILDSKIIIK